MGNNPEMKFPLRADGDFILQPGGKVLCFVGGVLKNCGPAPIATELVRLANLAHEAEAAMGLALQGMFHANGCAANPANVDDCECGHSMSDHVDDEDFCVSFRGLTECPCLEYKQAEPRCSCGTSEAADRMAAIIRKYNSNEVTK